jgi:DNA-binding LacI/PurR family transcriptional regulator
VNDSDRLNTALDDLAGRLDRSRGDHLYRQIASLFREQVQAGRIRLGDALPPQRELSTRWGVAEVTIRRALQSLAEEGLLHARPGSGTTVRDPGITPRRRSSSLRIGVAFKDLADGYPFFKPILQGLRDGDGDVAIRLFDVAADERTADTQPNYRQTLADLDGLIMMSPVNLALLAACQSRGLPTVLLFSDLADEFSHCIVPDYTSGVMQAVAHLAAKGRRKIAMATAGGERFSTGRWLDAHRAALHAFELERRPEWILQIGYYERDGAAALRQLLKLAVPPDAVLFASDFMARGALLSAHEAGLSVPADIAIIGAGPVLEEQGWTVPLATIDLGLLEMGRLARQIIYTAVQGITAAPATRHAVPARFTGGATA